MKRILPAIVLLLAACVHLPQLQPVDGPRRSLIEHRCRSIYPQGRWQLVHSIEARFPGGRRTFLTGVVVLSPTASHIHCVLMSLDGFVLFEAVDDGDVTVKRALGPLDHAGFGEGVMRDIRLIFLPPAGPVDRCGQFADGGEGCRFHADDNRIVDIVLDAAGGWCIRQTVPPRTVTAQVADQTGFPPKMILTAGGSAGYSLTLNLIQAVPLD